MLYTHQPRNADAEPLYEASGDRCFLLPPMRICLLGLCSFLFAAGTKYINRPDERCTYGPSGV